MIEILVAEWRDARNAIILVDWKDPVVAKAHIHLWTRLGHAEAALMHYARTHIAPVINEPRQGEDT